MNIRHLQGQEQQRCINNAIRYHDTRSLLDHTRSNDQFEGRHGAYSVRKGGRFDIVKLVLLCRVMLQFLERCGDKRREAI